MGLNFAPEAADLASEQHAHSHPDEREGSFRSEDEDPFCEEMLPSGWWVLPFAAVGLVPWIAGIDWIVGQL